MGRKPKNKAVLSAKESANKKSTSVIEITDMNPKHCTYRNPANMRYVVAIEKRDGQTVREGLMLLTNDHIARLNA